MRAWPSAPWTVLCRLRWGCQDLTVESQWPAPVGTASRGTHRVHHHSEFSKPLSVLVQFYKLTGQTDANDGCFGPADKSREHSRAPCPPALMLHGETKSPAGDRPAKVSGLRRCETPGWGLRGPHGLRPCFPTWLSAVVLCSPLCGTGPDPAGQLQSPEEGKGHPGAGQKQPRLPFLVWVQSSLASTAQRSSDPGLLGPPPSHLSRHGHGHTGSQAVHLDAPQARLRSAFGFTVIGKAAHVCVS